MDFKRSGQASDDSRQIDALRDDLGDGRHGKDVFGDESNHAIKYRTLSWPMVAVLMTTEIVSSGMFSLPSSAAVIGVVPTVVLILFLGIFATYTAKLLIDFKLHHPEVHSMGDAGYILFGPIGREVLAFGTVVFAILGTGTEFFAGYSALATLSDDKLCQILYLGIFAAATMVCACPRTLDQMSWLSIPACILIFVSALVGMVGAGLHPVPGRQVDVASSTSFFDAFSAVTNPVFAYAGHFLFFILISEMKRPQDAMKAAYVLQGSSTTLYIIFTIVLYYYIGNDIQSPALLSVDPVWAKAAFAIAIPNFLICGAIYTHTSSKLIFVRIFRESHHLHSHTVLSWSVWLGLVLVFTGVAFVLTVAVPIFNLLVGLAASLFAAWFTYGIAGAFFLHDAYADGGFAEYRRQWVQTILAVATWCAGAFICVAGCYVTIKGIVLAYQTGAITRPFSC